MPEIWSRKEVELIVADYFSMLEDEVAFRPFNKTAHRKALLPLLNHRSKGSVEFKHANITAVLNELGAPGIDGYKPRSKYQDLLFEVVEARLAQDASLRRDLLSVVSVSARDLGDALEGLREVAPPERDKRSEDRLRERLSRPKRARRAVDFLGVEARNVAIGKAGELAVLDFERKRLWKAGERKLSDRVEHVAVTQGDGLGYDILSFEVNGRERLIEVKTTSFSKTTPFFVSRNELEVSREQDKSYHLYRVFRLRTTPGLFRVNGPLDLVCDLEPVQFSGRVA